MKGRVADWRALVVAATMPMVLDACAVDGGARIETTWTGGDTGAFAVPAAGAWCAKGRYLEIRAARGDTGVAVAIFPKDSAPDRIAGVYKVIKEAADSSRPTAAVAMRWSDPTAVAGFRSDSGTVTVRRGTNGVLEGDVQTSGPLLGGLPRRIQVDGSFRAVAVDTASRDCAVLLEPSRDSVKDSVRGPRPDTAPRVVVPRTALDSLRDSIMRSRLDLEHARDLLQKRVRTQGSGRGAPNR